MCDVSSCTTLCVGRLEEKGGRGGGECGRGGGECGRGVWGRLVVHSLLFTVVGSLISSEEASRVHTSQK